MKIISISLSFLCFIISLSSIELYSQNSNAELVNQKTQISINNGKLTKTENLEIRINNREGESFTDIEIPFSKMIKLSKIQAAILDSKGIIVRKLKNSEIIERSSRNDFSFYEDHFVKEFSLKHHTFPYTIVYSYQLQMSSFLSIDAWSPILSLKVPTRKAELILDVPQSYKINYYEQLTDSAQIDTINDIVKYRWVASYNKTIEDEEFAPSPAKFLPCVHIVPFNFQFEKKGTFESWKTFGNWEYSINESLNNLPQSEINRMHTLLEGISDKREKVKTIFHFLQDNTRYINISMETGGLVPYPASYVAANKYGDCKALAIYMKALLEVVNIKSYYTDVYAGHKIKTINRQFPSQQFNHIILCVPLDKDTIWLDCTSKGPFGRLGLFTQNRDVFLVDKDNSHFVRTPTLSTNEVTDSRNVVFSFDGTEQLACFRKKLKSSAYENLSSVLTFNDKAMQDKYIRNNCIEDEMELTPALWQIKSPHRDSAFIELSYNAKTTSVYKIYGNDLIVKILPFSPPVLTKPVKRKFPVQIDFPISKTDTFTYLIPPVYTGIKIPQNIHLKTVYGEYKSEYLIEKKVLTVIKHYVLSAGTYPTGEYPKFYNFVEKIIEAENNSYLTATKKE